MGRAAAPKTLALSSPNTTIRRTRAVSPQRSGCSSHSFRTRSAGIPAAAIFFASSRARNEASLRSPSAVRPCRSRSQSSKETPDPSMPGWRWNSPRRRSTSASISPAERETPSFAARSSTERAKARS